MKTQKSDSKPSGLQANLSDHLPDSLKSIGKLSEMLSAQTGSEDPYEALQKLTGSITAKEVESIKDDNAAAKQRILELKIGAAGVPKRFQEKRISQFKVETQEQKAVKVACIEYAKSLTEAVKTGRSVIMTGNHRTGKCHLATAILSHALKLGYTGLFITVPEAMRLIRQSFSSDHSEMEAFDFLTKPELLVLDEVGIAIGDSEKRKAMLFDILNRRYNDMLPTIIISNMSYEGLNDYLEEKVVMRLEENNGLSLAFGWKGKSNW